jgi:hypothetical protein
MVRGAERVAAGSLAVAFGTAFLFFLQLRHRLPWAALDRVAAVDAIPVDARHYAKVDYAALEALVRRRGLG